MSRTHTVIWFVNSNPCIHIVHNFTGNHEKKSSHIVEQTKYLDTGVNNIRQMNLNFNSDKIELGLHHTS